MDGEMWQGWEHVVGCGDMWQGVGTCGMGGGRVWGHVAGVLIRQLHERSWSALAMCKLLCANCYVQTAMCKLVVQNDIFACNFLNNGPILIKKNLFESS